MIINSKSQNLPVNQTIGLSSLFMYFSVGSRFSSQFPSGRNFFIGENETGVRKMHFPYHIYINCIKLPLPCIFFQKWTRKAKVLPTARNGNFP